MSEGDRALLDQRPPTKKHRIGKKPDGAPLVENSSWKLGYVKELQAKRQKRLRPSAPPPQLLLPPL
eukprot:5625876-Pyramimonas_sp.AAC.1